MAKRQRRRRRERRKEHSRRGGWQTRRSVITGAGLAAGAALSFAAPVSADPLYLTVDNLNDPNSAGACSDAVADDCSLRQAIDVANTNSGQYDYIYFQAGLSGTVSLTTLAGGDIEITDAVFVFGPDPREISVDAAPNSRIFAVDPASDDTVEIAGVTLTGGDVAGNGGAIENIDAQLVVFNTILTGNTAEGAGGAISEAGQAYNNGADDRIYYSTFSNNHAESGGGIFALNSWGHIRETTFSGNGADSGYGGAIDGTSGYLVDSTVSGNNAAVSGGGVSAFGDIRLFGTILANNTAGASQPDIYAPLGGDGSYDLIENPGVLGANPSIITGQDPQLGGLQNNGGYTPTLKPAADSPVVDQSYSYSYYDQRVSDRRVDNPNRANAATGTYAAADIGSVELTLQEGPQATPTTPPPPPPPVAHKKKKCKKKKKKHRSAESAKKKRCKKKKKRATEVHRGIHFALPPASASRWGEAGHNPFRLQP